MSTPTATPPSAHGEIEVVAPPDRVYSLVTDLAVLAELGDEVQHHRWLDGVTSARVGARFRGGNRNGRFRWHTVSRVTDATPGERFAFTVSSLGLPVARWQYDITPTRTGCRVAESTWDRRATWFRVLTTLATGVWRRDERNQRHIQNTLRRLKTRAESGIPADEITG